MARAAEYGRVPTDCPAPAGRRGSHCSILCCWLNRASDRAVGRLTGAPAWSRRSMPHRSALTPQ